MQNSTQTNIHIPELALLAGTRALLGFGFGLLLANRFGTEKRKSIGWTLVSIGALSTIPIAFEIFGKGFKTGIEAQS